MTDIKGTRAKRLKDLDESMLGPRGFDTDGPFGKEKKIPGRHPALYSSLITLLIMLLLMCAAALTCRLGAYDGEGTFRYMIDPEGVIRGPLLLFLNPEEVTREEYYELEIMDIFDRDLELDVRELELEALSEELDERESALDDRETAMDDKESIIDEWLEKINSQNAQGTGNSVDISIVAKKVENMTPAKAANMLTEMDVEQAALLLSQMKPAKVGPILDNMTEDVSAAIVAQMLPEPDDLSDLEEIP